MADQTKSELALEKAAELEAIENFVAEPAEQAAPPRPPVIFAERMLFDEKGEPIGYGRIVDREAMKRAAGVYPQNVMLLNEKDLLLHGHAGEPIWCMKESDGVIGIRLDDGDSGTVYLTDEQALDLAAQLTKLATPAAIEQARPQTPNDDEDSPDKLREQLTEQILAKQDYRHDLADEALHQCDACENGAAIMHVLRERGLFEPAAAAEPALERTPPQDLCEYCKMPSLRSCPRCSQTYKRVKLLTHCASDFPISRTRLVAQVGEYDAQINQHGAVSIVTTGLTLGVKPGEFTFICDCRAVAVPEPAAQQESATEDDVWAFAEDHTLDLTQKYDHMGVQMRLDDLLKLFANYRARQAEPAPTPSRALELTNNHGLFEFRGVDCPYCHKPIALWAERFKGSATRIMHVRHLETDSAKCRAEASSLGAKEKWPNYRDSCTHTPQCSGVVECERKLAERGDSKC